VANDKSADLQIRLVRLGDGNVARGPNLGKVRAMRTGLNEDQNARLFGCDWLEWRRSEISRRNREFAAESNWNRREMNHVQRPTGAHKRSTGLVYLTRDSLHTRLLARK